MIPDFDIHGTIPPIRPGANGESSDRAPYRTDMLTFCKRFGGTPKRRVILNGLLDLRDALRETGFVTGFQWLDGSFAEDAERLRGRAPADIDVVTFTAGGSKEVQQSRVERCPELFDHALVKQRFWVDHYLVPTDDASDVHGERLSHKVAYWYSMWAHQRGTQRWKGFVSVPLVSNDASALEWLTQQAPHGEGAP